MRSNVKIGARAGAKKRIPDIEASTGAIADRRGNVPNVPSARHVRSGGALVPAAGGETEAAAEFRDGSRLGGSQQKQYAASTVEKPGELQGTYCKHGQTSAGLTNALGDVWIREIATVGAGERDRRHGCHREKGGLF